MALDDLKNIMQDNYEALLMDYASGKLDEAQSLIVACHLTLSPQARQIVAQCESIGGCLINNTCDPVDMNTGSLQSVLDCLDKPHACEKAPCGHKHESHCEFDLPEPIQHYIHKYSTLPWKAYEPGIQYCTLATACKKSRIQFFKFEPGVRSTSQNTTGEKITFIIDGIMHIDDRIYRRGDLIVIDDAISTQSIADKEQGYACLIVSAANNNKSWFRTILKLITQ